MEAAARPSGHKRNFSAFDTQLAGFDPSGKAARPSEEQAPGAQQEQQQEEQQPFTETAAFNLEALRNSQEEIFRQIEELQGAGGARGGRGAAARPMGGGASWRRRLADAAARSCRLPLSCPRYLRLDQRWWSCMLYGMTA